MALSENEPSVKDVLTPSLYAFLDSCLYDKGIRDVSDELKDEMILDLAERLQSWLLQSVAGVLDEESAQTLETMNAQGASQEETMQFLSGVVPNLNEIFEQAMIEFKKTYLG